MSITTRKRNTTATTTVTTMKSKDTADIQQRLKHPLYLFMAINSSSNSN